MKKLKLPPNLKGTVLLISICLSSFWAFGQDKDFHFKWDNGFKLESADEQFKLKFGGRIMWDNAFFFQDDSLEMAFGELHNGTEFRRVRFYHSGTVYSNVGYKLQLDFAGGGISFKDVYISFKDFPVLGELRLGHFKEPFHLEALTSSKYITFMERGLPNALVTERNTGLMFFDECLDDRLGWQVGLFRNANSAGNDVMAEDGFAFTGRLTGLPAMNEDGSRLWHVGASLSYRKPTSEAYRVEARPEAHLGNKYVSTGWIDEVDNIKMFNVETALVVGPFSLQGEYTGSYVDMNVMAAEDHSFNGYYAEASYFLTGEHRKYKGSYEGFDRVKPTKNLGEGCGAWQVALRYSSLDLNSGNLNAAGIAGGELTNITAGVNWYVNPVTRVMFNYGLAQVQDVGNASIGQVRVQLDF